MPTEENASDLLAVKGNAKGAQECIAGRNAHLVVVSEQRVNVFLEADGRRAVDHIIYLPSQPPPAKKYLNSG